MPSTFNICLVPSGDFGQDLAEYSRMLSTRSLSRFILGRASVPHATVLQFSTDRPSNEVKGYFNELGVAKQLRLDLAGLTLLPGDDDDLWCEIAVLKSSALQSLQDNVIDGMQPSILEIKNAVHDKFRPHFTVALIKIAGANFALHSSLAPKSLIRATGVDCTLRIGVSGENFQVTSLLE
jgi:hypothetical protein